MSNGSIKYEFCKCSKLQTYKKKQHKFLLRSSLRQRGNIFKRISIILLIYAFIINLSFSQKTDDRLSTLFVEQNFFKLKEEYPKLKELASERWQLYTESYLCSYFNSPIEANEKINLLLSKYPSWLLPAHKLGLAIMMAENEVKSQNYAKAASIYAQLVEQLASSLDSSTLKPYQDNYYLYNALHAVSPINIAYTKKKTEIPLKQDSIGLITLPVHSFTEGTSNKLDFILDFGAAFCMTEEKYVSELGIKYWLILLL